MKTNVEHFIKAWNEVPVLAEIMRIVEDKKFIEPSGDSKKIGQPVIGVMSPLVRAMYTFLDGNAKALIAAKKQTLFPFACPGLGLDCIGKIAVEADFCPYASALLKIKESHPLAVHQDFVREFMFSLIRSGLPDHGEAISNLSFIKNFQITTPEKPESYPDTFEMFQGWEGMTLQQLIEVSITGTFLEPLAEILGWNEFVDDETPAFATGDSLIRLMKPLEKAIVTKISILSQGMKEKEEEHNLLLKGENFVKKPRFNIDFTSLGGLSTIISIDMSHGAQEFEPKDPLHPDYIRVQDLKKEIQDIVLSVKPYQDIIWPIIQMDLDPEKRDGFDGIAIRAGFHIVAFNQPVEVEE